MNEQKIKSSQEIHDELIKAAKKLDRQINEGTPTDPNKINISNLPFGMPIFALAMMKSGMLKTDESEKRTNPTEEKK